MKHEVKHFWYPEKQMLSFADFEWMAQETSGNVNMTASACVFTFGFQQTALGRGYDVMCDLTYDDLAVEGMMPGGLI